VIIYPYDMDLMSFYEFYAIAMPIFMPTALSKYVFHQRHASYDGRAECIPEIHGDREVWQGCTENPLWDESLPFSPFMEQNIDAAREILKFTDYVRWPHVQGFSSLPTLLHDLMSVDMQLISTNMRAFNEDTFAKTSQYWRQMLTCIASQKVGGIPREDCHRSLKDPETLFYLDDHVTAKRSFLPGYEYVPFANRSLPERPEIELDDPLMDTIDIMHGSA